jgi:hypothetical protein
MNILRTSAIILLTSGIQLSAHAAVSASLSSDQVATGESVQLLLQRDGQANSQPDLSPLAQDFRILDTSSGSNVQIINGQVSAKTQFQVSLVPNHDGKLQIPPIHWGNDTSAALELSVGGTSTPNQPNAAVASGGTNHVFFDMRLDNKQSYVNGAVLLTMRLHTDQMLSQASLDLPANSDVQVQQIGKDKTVTESRDGREFQVVERQYVLLPQRSGHITLNGPVLDALVADTSVDDPFANDSFFKNVFSHMQLGSMSSAKRPLHLQGKPIELDVQARPSQIDPKDWLPTLGMVLDADIHPNSTAIQVGEPLTLHLHLHADGTTAGQLPDLTTMMPLPDGVKAYPDQPKLDTQIDEGHLTAVRDQDVALIASRPGKFTLPAMRIPFWDESRNALRYVELAPRTLDVTPAMNASPSVPMSAQNNATPNETAKSSVQLAASSSTDNSWRWASAGLSALWLATLGLWWRTSRTGAKKPPAAKREPKSGKSDNVDRPMRAFQRAAQENDAQASRRHLLAWSRVQWPVDALTGLRALAKRLQDPDISLLLHELDQACYAGVAWDGANLAQAMKGWRNPVRKESSKEEIAELYA